MHQGTLRHRATIHMHFLVMLPARPPRRSAPAETHPARAAAFESDPLTKMARITSISDKPAAPSTTTSHHRTLLHEVTRRPLGTYTDFVKMIHLR
jgi:hypothetical protein